jgi:hypothetical protein
LGLSLFNDLYVMSGSVESVNCHDSWQTKNTSRVCFLNFRKSSCNFLCLSSNCTPPSPCCSLISISFSSFSASYLWQNCHIKTCFLYHKTKAWPSPFSPLSSKISLTKRTL